jgi:hypothetical protein
MEFTEALYNSGLLSVYREETLVQNDYSQYQEDYNSNRSDYTSDVNVIHIFNLSKFHANAEE